MTPSIESVDNGTCKVVRRIDDPGITRTVVSSRIASVDHRVAKGLVLIIEGEPNTDALPEALRGALPHLL